MRGNPRRRAQVGVCFVGVHAIALGVAVVGALDGSTLFPFALLAYAGLPWWLLVDVAVPAWLGTDRFMANLIVFAVLNLALHACLWWWAWRRACRSH